MSKWFLFVASLNTFVGFFIGLSLPHIALCGFWAALNFGSAVFTFGLYIKGESLE